MMGLLGLLENMAVWCFIALGICTTIAAVHSQPNTPGFISIDCGIGDGYSYNDDITSILYTSDANYIDSGANHYISTNYKTSTLLMAQMSSLRSIPNRSWNCYTLAPMVQVLKYLIRASFINGTMMTL